MFIQRLNELGRFQLGKRVIDGKEIKWFPVLMISENYMGLSDYGQWVVETREGLHVLSDERPFVFILPLLERSTSSIKLILSDFFKSLSIETNPWEIFPYLELIRAGLEKESDYWAELAFNWFKELSAKEKHSMKEALSVIVDAKWASQKVRHLARKELKRLLK